MKLWVYFESRFQSLIKNLQYFSDCSCEDTPEVTLKSGYCPTECNNFLPYITVFSIGNLIAATARVGNFLVKVRSIDPKDKSFSMAFSAVIYILITGIPFKYVYGKLADSACMIWQENDAASSCSDTSSQKGNCWLYDPDKFRNYLHATSFTMVMIGSILDCCVIYFAHKMNHLYVDDDELGEVDGSRKQSTKENEDSEL